MLVCGAFIYLIPVEKAGILPWMATVVVCRELIVTGIRGMVEAAGKKFGADWFGKLKMGLQCEVLIGVLLLAWPAPAMAPRTCSRSSTRSRSALLWAMLAATVGSGVQNIVESGANDGVSERATQDRGH